MSEHKFICPDEHTTHKSFNWQIDATEEVISCGVCGQPAVHWVKTVGRVQGKPSYKMRRFRCKGCNAARDVNVINKNYEVDESPRPCPECDGQMVLHYGGWSIDRFGEDTNWPYFDRGLGKMLHSKKHREEVCREMGVVPIDGDIDYSSDYNKLEAKIAAEDKIVEDYQEQVDTSPAYAEYREMKDKGWKPKFSHREQNAGPKIDPFNETPQPETSEI
jgi:hypothetical protein